MFQTQPGQDFQESRPVAGAPSFLALIVFALSLTGLLVALEMATQQTRVTISHQQVVTSAKAMSAK